MYQNYFTNTPLATKTLYDLVDVKPEEKVMLQALYEIFAMNYEKNPQASARAKQILLTDYPYSSFAEFARNPKNNTFVKSSEEVENEYKMAFALYESEKFTESQGKIEQVILKFPKDALIPKLNLLNAFNAGKTGGKEVMILQLEQIVLNYAKTPEGIKAKEMLNYLKSDIAFQATDNKGNKTPNSPFNGPGQSNNIQQSQTSNFVPSDSAGQPMKNTPPQNNNNIPKKTGNNTMQKLLQTTDEVKTMKQ